MGDPVTTGILIGVGVGGGIGALTSKKPLEGALIGAAVGGATGGVGGAFVGPSAGIGVAGVGPGLTTEAIVGPALTSSGSSILGALASGIPSFGNIAQVAGAAVSLGGAITGAGAQMQAADTQAAVMQQNAAIARQNAASTASVAARDAARSTEQAVLAERITDVETAEVKRDIQIANAAFADRERRTRQARERQLATIRARLGTRGVSTTVGSPLLLIAESQREIEDELAAIRYESEVVRTGLEGEAAKIQFQGTTTARAARQAAEDTLLTGNLRSAGFLSEASLLAQQAPGVRSAGRTQAFGTVLTGLGSTGLALSRRL